MICERHRIFVNCLMWTKKTKQMFAKTLKKLFFYFLLFAGIILSTSHLGNNFMGTEISDEEGYLLAMGICCLAAFLLEYVLPSIRKKS